MEALVGASGWTGAGLLGLVMWWLAVKHLPAKDAQFERLLDIKDGQIKAAYGQYKSDLKDYREDHRVHLEKILEHCRRENEELGSMVRAQFETFQRTLIGLEGAIRALREELHVNEVAAQRRHETDVGQHAKPPVTSQ